MPTKNAKFTMSELKRMQRAARKANAKLKRKVQTLTNIRNSLTDLKLEKRELECQVAVLTDIYYDGNPIG